jgi:hypothetical protein
MTKCFLCKKEIWDWVLFGNESLKEESKPICFQCLKQTIDADGNNSSLKNKIEGWLTEQRYSFTQINEHVCFFHFVLKDVGSFKVIIDIFQKKEKPHLIVGFMIFLIKELSEKIRKYSPEQKEKLKRKVDDFLSSIRVDSRIGYAVGYEIISENGNYGARYFIKSKTKNITKEKFYKILGIVESVSEKSGRFVNSELNF